MHVVILGAGISGLATGWFVRQRFGSQVKISIVEKALRVGGWIQSIQSNDFLFELGPRSLRSKGAGSHSIDLIEALGLQSEVVAADPVAKRRYLWTDSQLRELPSGPLDLLKSPLARQMLPAIFKEPFRRRSQVEDESIHDFVSRRLSPYIAENLFDPMVSGIYAGDTRRLSLKSCFPLLHEWEQQGGSLIRGAFKGGAKLQAQSEWGRELQKQPIFSFRRGMETLVQALQEQLEADLYLGEEVIELKGKGVQTDKRLLEADRVISCLPAPALGKLLDNEDLQSAPMASLTVLCLGYGQACLPVPGFGYLVPSREKENILGVVFDSSTFPQQNLLKNQTRLTVMMGGMHRPDLVDVSAEEALAIAKGALRRHLGLNRDPDELHIKRVRHGIPQYHLGHAAKIAALRQEFPEFILSGNSFDGIAVNDCIAKAKSVAENL